MKQKSKNKSKDKKAAMVVPAELNAEFRSICEGKMLKPYAVHVDILENWILKERKKMPAQAIVANG